MGRPPMTKRVDYADVQGLVRFGYRRMTEASYALLRVKDPAAARAWLRSAPVTSAVDVEPAALNRAAGRVHGRGPQSARRFRLGDRGFLTGVSGGHDARKAGRAVWATWKTTRPCSGNGAVPRRSASRGDVLCRARRPRGLRAKRHGSRLERRLREIRTGCTRRSGRVEPFGFTDGISQPQIDWEQQRDVDRPQIDYRTSSRSVNFCSGILTSTTNTPTGRCSTPMRAARICSRRRMRRRKRTWAATERISSCASWTGRARLLAVSPPAIRRRCRGSREAGGGVRRAHESRAIRWCRFSGQPIPGIGSETGARFGRINSRSTRIRRARRCPFGAHIRRANPRNADYPGRPTGLQSSLPCSASVRRVSATI